VVILCLILLVAYLYVERLSPQNTRESETFQGARPDAPSRESIAVIPFVNMSGEEDMEYFGDGLAEEILNLLTKLDELNVAARTSSFYFKNKDVDIPTIGKHLGVQHVLEGSVRYQEDRIRVTVQLINTANGFHLWSETYDRTLSDTFSLQDEIASNVVDNLHVLLSNTSRGLLETSRIVDSLAFDYYLRGRDYLRRLPDQAVLSNAERMFNQAIQLEPDYADAHAGICDASLMRYRLSHDNRDFSIAETACQQALSLNSGAVSVHVALGNLYRNSGEYQRAEATFAQAISLGGNVVEALVGLGETLMVEGKYDEARDSLMQAIALQSNYWPAPMAMGNLLLAIGNAKDVIPYYQRINYLLPESGMASNNLGGAFYLVGRFEDAVETWQESLRSSPSAAVYSNLGSSFYFLRRFDDAVEMYKRSIELTPDDFELWGNLADAYRFTDSGADLARTNYLKALKLAVQRLAINPLDAQTLGLMGHYYANIGQRRKALEHLSRANQLAPEDMYTYYFSATAFSALGDLDQAMEALEKALSLGYFKHLVSADAGLDSLRSMTRYHVLMDEAR